MRENFNVGLIVHALILSSGYLLGDEVALANDLLEERYHQIEIQL